jgi:hypothetical protein
MSIYETDLDRYCPLRTDINGETRKCVYEVPTEGD